jgi:hypothetical protein
MEGGVTALVDALVSVRPRCRGGRDIFVGLDCQRGRSTSHDMDQRCRFVKDEIRIQKRTLVEGAQKISYTEIGRND